MDPLSSSWANEGLWLRNFNHCFEFVFSVIQSCKDNNTINTYLELERKHQTSLSSLDIRPVPCRSSRQCAGNPDLELTASWHSGLDGPNFPQFPLFDPASWNFLEKPIFSSFLSLRLQDQQILTAPPHQNKVSLPQPSKPNPKAKSLVTMGL